MAARNRSSFSDPIGQKAHRQMKLWLHRSAETSRGKLQPSQLVLNAGGQFKAYERRFTVSLRLGRPLVPAIGWTRTDPLRDEQSEPLQAQQKSNNRSSRQQCAHQSFSEIIVEHTGECCPEMRAPSVRTEPEVNLSSNSGPLSGNT
jgi:hypothetical protein